ncbi:triacylglycerol lipase [Aspergillus minisclerotigenes]|uniref:Triacylglycerol lipase n=1 Tax=Aspergillus minisclerotigenes TaxID=656917 RepID=A0A5N6JGR9_9EURO|nr:triacylglycerol lipase [Aspergillus minisclerotigenes]
MRCAVATLRADTSFASLKRVCQYHRLNHRIPRGFHSSTCRYQLHEGTGPDPRLEGLGKVIEDEYAMIREVYDTPKHAIVLAHGLLGFDELRLAGPYFPGVQYWRGIKEALSVKGIEVITATVPPSGSIEARAEELAKDIAAGAQGKAVNIIAHSMRGLDSRYMISHLQPKDFKILSLTTIATPHRGSAVADYILKQIGDERLAQVYYALEQIKFETGAFSQLTQDYMEKTFNPTTPDVEDVRYFSYGASMQPSFWSVFRLSHRYLEQVEGHNDGLVSVASSRWGGKDGYKGTLMGVNHLDLINWTNRLKWLAGEITGNRRRFNAIAFYLAIADMLAKEGL